MKIAFKKIERSPPILLLPPDGIAPLVQLLNYHQFIGFKIVSSASRTFFYTIARNCESVGTSQTVSIKIVSTLSNL